MSIGMYYEDLIERLNVYSSEHEQHGGITAEAADAIKVLLTMDNGRLIPKVVSCPGGWKGYCHTIFKCPNCKKAVRLDEIYCHKCGQAILFPKVEYDKENNKIWLNFERSEQRG